MSAVHCSAAAASAQAVFCAAVSAVLIVEVRALVLAWFWEAVGSLCVQCAWCVTILAQHTGAGQGAVARAP